MKKKIHQEDMLLLLCILCEAAAFLMALLFRYVVLNPLFWNPERDYNFYKMFFVVVLFFYAAVFMWRKKRRPAAWEMNGWEHLTEVLKQHFFLLIFLLIFLYFINCSLKVSRTVMAFLILYGVIFDLLLRVGYGKTRAKRYFRENREEQVLLLSMKEEAERIRWSIERYGYANEDKEILVQCKVADTVVLSEEADPQKALEEALQAAEKREDGSLDMIYLSAGAAKYLGADSIKALEQLRIPVCRGLEMDGIGISADVVISEGGSAAVYQSLLTRKCPVLGVEYTTAGLAEVAAHLLCHTEEMRGSYVCFSNVHTTVMAAENADYREILNGSAVTFPDGKPVAGKIWAQGYSEAERVAGPDLMAELFRRSQGTGKKHYFYGSTEKTLAALKERLAENYPFMEVAGMYSPPFRELTEEEDAEVVKRINDSGADFVWIGLGAPKQEKWMAAHQGRINGVMLGVGAGFDFHAGTVKRAPRILQKLGLEWLYRMFQDPKRLVKRYLVTNTKFIIYTTFKSGRS